MTAREQPDVTVGRDLELGRGWWTTWWNVSLSPTQELLGWLVATALFVGWMTLLGGPSHSDLGESLYSTIAIAHGHFGCLFSSVRTSVPVVSATSPSVAPLYPLVTGMAEALLRIGHGTAYPVLARGSTHCAAVYDAAYRWAQQSGAVAATQKMSYLSWIPLSAGAIAVARAPGRGRRGGEFAALFVVALEPLVASCLGVVFHPEYLWATGLVLVAVSAARRGRWELCGVVAALAVLSQQFALLAVAVLFVAAPGRARQRFTIYAAVTGLAVTVPMAILTSGRALGAVVYGSSVVRPTSSLLESKGGTVLWEAHLHGALLFGVSRVLPVLAAGAVAVWAKRRVGPRVTDLDVLLSMTAMAFACRLVFEQNLFGYYFAALSVALVLLDLAQSRLRLRLVVWILVVTMAFHSVPAGLAARGDAWSAHAVGALAALTAVILLVGVARDVARGRAHTDLFAMLIFVVVVFHSQVFFGDPGFSTLPDWLWQLLLVPTGFLLAARPLRGAMGRDDGSGPSRERAVESITHEFVTGTRT